MPPSDGHGGTDIPKVVTVSRPCFFNAVEHDGRSALGKTHALERGMSALRQERKRTCAAHQPMSAMGHERTSRDVQTDALLGSCKHDFGGSSTC